jgi:hypothetical protein
MASSNPTDPGASQRFQTPSEEDHRDEGAVLRHVLYLHPGSTLTRAELTREMIDLSDDAVERAVRDLAGTGLLHRPGDDEFVRPTRAAIRFFELEGGAG